MHMTLVPGRLNWLDLQIDWQGKSVLDLGCAGGFMAEALGARGAQVTGLYPAAEVARTHDPAMFIKPRELRAAMQDAGLVPGAMTGLVPRGINRRFDLTFGPLPVTAILYMAIARKPLSGAVS